MSQDDVSYRMVCPLVPARPSHLVKATPTGRTTLIITKPFAVGAHRHLPAGVHGDSGIAAVHPEPYPLFKGRSATSMDQHHGGHFFSGFQLRDSQPGKNASRFAAKRQPFK